MYEKTADNGAARSVIRSSRSVDAVQGIHSHYSRSSADEAGQAKDRRSGGLGFSARSDRRPRRRGHRFGGRYGGNQFVGPPESAGRHDGRDDRRLQGGLPRRQTSHRELRHSFRSAAGGHRQRAAGGHPARQGGGREYDQTGRRGGFS